MLSRRAFNLGAIAAAAGAAVACIGAMSPASGFRTRVQACPGTKYGRKLGKPCGTIQVFLNGDEISWDCFAFDSGDGWADCYAARVENEAGDNLVRPIDPATNRAMKERRYGVITTNPPVAELVRVLGPVCW